MLRAPAAGSERNRPQMQAFCPATNRAMVYDGRDIGGTAGICGRAGTIGTGPESAEEVG
jgi:hypothetical protein